MKAEPQPAVVACYREFAPGDELREHVRAFFWFGPPSEGTSPTTRRITWQLQLKRGDAFVSPLFADANLSLVVHLGQRFGANGAWTRADALHAHVIGAMTRVGAAPPRGHAAMIGAYFQPARAHEFADLPLTTLTDRIVPVADLWGASSADLPFELDEMSESGAIDRLEAELLRRLGRRRQSRTSVDVPGLAEWTLRSGGQVSVERLADAAGVSRQRLTRVFQEFVGVTPKRYCRLARFHSTLGFVGRERVAWARVAAAVGYADQSHMIAEFREFSSLTPQQIASGNLFHPFIQHAVTRGVP